MICGQKFKYPYSRDSKIIQMPYPRAKAINQIPTRLDIDGCINGLREQNKSCISEEMFSRGSKCNNKEYTVLEGSAGRKVISNKNEAKQFIKRKTTYLETWNQLATVSCGKYYIYGTCTENSNGRRIERPFL